MIKQTWNELVKFVRLKYGMVIILLFIMINAFSALNNNSVRTGLYPEESEEILAFYYGKWGGAYDSKYDAEILTYYAQVNSDSYRLSDDRVLPDSLREKILDPQTVQDMMKKFYASYTLAKNNGYVDTVLDMRGSTILLESYKSIDFFFVLIVVVAVCIIFSVDKQRGQEDIVKGTRYGNREVVKAKMLLVSLLVVFLQAVKLIFLCIPVIQNFYMPDMRVALQAVDYMHDATSAVSVAGAFAFLVLCETAGLIFTGLVCGFVITGNAGSAEGFICGFAAAYVPIFLLDRNQFYRNIPLPSAYLAPYHFLESIQEFRNQYIVTLAVMLCLTVIINRVYTYGFRIDRRRWRLK